MNNAAWRPASAGVRSLALASMIGARASGPKASRTADPRRQTVAALIGVVDVTCPHVGAEP